MPDSLFWGMERPSQPKLISGGTACPLTWPRAQQTAGRQQEKAFSISNERWPSTHPKHLKMVQRELNERKGLQPARSIDLDNRLLQKAPKKRSKTYKMAVNKIPMRIKTWGGPH